MQISARIGTTIELVAASLQNSTIPSDRVLNTELRKRRFIGSKDRRFISSLYWGVWRYMARLCASFTPPTEPHKLFVQDDIAAKAAARKLVIGALAAGVADQQRPLAEWFEQSSPYAPSAPDKSETELFNNIAANGFENLPAHAQAECPEFLFKHMDKAALIAMQQSAPTVLRANTLVTAMQPAQEALGTEVTELCRYAPHGITLTKRINLDSVPLYRKGGLEPMDEGSQLVSAMVEAGPGMDVLDFCAGGGGKSLAMAAIMDNKGHITACDIAASRLKNTKQRAKHAHISIVETITLGAKDELTAPLDNRTFDRVVVDAPCTGTGTWRRQPDARWRLAEATVKLRTGEQEKILQAAAGHVKPGGRLVYITCSFLELENSDIVNGFCAKNSDFAPLDAHEIFNHIAKQPWPETGAHKHAPFLQLSPTTTGTDGFFIAILERR